MFEEHALQRSWHRRFLTLLVLSLGMTLSAAPPAWWSQPDTTNHSVIDPSVTDRNPMGPANIGQAKYMAKRALDAINTLDPSLATQVRDKLTLPQPVPGSQGTFLPAILDFDVPDPLPADWHERQHAPLLIGQLKAISAPFYDVLHSAAPLWLDNVSSDPSQQGQLQLNATKDQHDPTNFYPWSSDPGDDRNQAVATIGQLKAAFSLRFETLATTLDSDHDGLTNAREAILHTDPNNPDSDGDGMPDAWEVKWGLDPLNPADAAADADGDNLTNLTEFQTGTCPTGAYRIEVLPVGANPYFHSAADDGSVVVQASPIWDPTTALERITAPDASGNRTLEPLPPDTWPPLDTLTANLIANGTLHDGDTLSPSVLASSNGTYRVFETNARLLILREPGYPAGSLASGVAWHSINNQGQAAAITEHFVPSVDGVPEHHEADILISYGYYTYTIHMPAVWFPAPTIPSILAFSDSGDVLISRSLTNPDGSIGHETYLHRTGHADFTLVRQPGLGGESIVALSSSNSRILGTGPNPFQITPDGTPVLLENLQILTSPSAQTIPLATLYRNPLVPHHITSDGRITLSTTDASNQPVLLQIVPSNDADTDGMMDDWERFFAKSLLESANSPEAWGTLHAALLAGNLSPTIDYTGEGICTADIATLFNRPVPQQSPDGIEMQSQTRRNLLAWGSHVSATKNTPARDAGLYFYENAGYYGAAMDVTSFSQLQPEFMATQILSNPWETTKTGSSFSQFSVLEYAGDPPHTNYFGDDQNSRTRLVANRASPVDRTRSYLKITRRLPYPYNFVSIPEVMDAEVKELTIPAGKLLSDWIETVPPVVAGYEYTVSLDRIDLAVDANRDGAISFDGKDATTAQKPFVFWVNDDHDVKHPVDVVGAPLPATLGQEDVFDDVKDCSDGVITCVRDLEDFTRLHLSVGCIADELRNGTMSVGLEFTGIAGNPTIKVYLANEGDGGIKHLLDNTEGEAQIADPEHNTTLGTVSASLDFHFPCRTWKTLSLANPNTHLIFEGDAEGKGRLQLTFYKGSQKIGSCGSLWIELKNIKQMYQRWNANEVENSGDQWTVWPSKSTTQDSDSKDPPAPQTDDEKDFLLFVHGWNMSKPEKRAFAETAYKRMWQIGYKGRFGAFCWPTFYASGAAENADPGNFNGSEQRAWESSDALLALLTQMNEKYPGRVHIMAHSMGNIVASEALHKASSVVVKNYVASQAAIPADVFKHNPDVTAQWATVMARTFTGHGLTVPGAKAVTTPNVYAYYYPNTRDFVYCTKQYPEIGKPYMTGSGGATNWHNYLNPDDWALGAWIYNQSRKPNTAMFSLSMFTSRDYSYKFFSGLDVWGFWTDEWGSASDHGLYFGTQGDSPDSTYEIFCYCAQARSNPTGRQSNVGGRFSNGTQSNFSEFGDLHPGHSSQFLYSICERWRYWDKLLDTCNI